MQTIKDLTICRPSISRIRLNSTKFKKDKRKLKKSRALIAPIRVSRTKNSSQESNHILNAIQSTTSKPNRVQASNHSRSRIWLLITY